MYFFKMALIIFISFASGIVISGGVFAFIASIGIVPKMAKKTNTKKFIPIYEDAIVVGGIFGSTTMLISYYIPIGVIPVIILSTLIGVFFGCLAVSLAEVIDVIPVLTRKGKIAFALPVFIFAIAIGKLVGSVLYYVLPGFYLF